MRRGSPMREVSCPRKGAFLLQGWSLRRPGHSWRAEAHCPAQAHLAHHPKEARPVLGHVQLWIHGIQEPLEVLTPKPCTELSPLCHVPKRLLRKGQNGEPLQATALPIKAFHSPSKPLLSTYCVQSLHRTERIRNSLRHSGSTPAGDTVAQTTTSPGALAAGRCGQVQEGRTQSPC